MRHLILSLFLFFSTICLLAAQDTGVRFNLSAGTARPFDFMPDAGNGLALALGIEHTLPLGYSRSLNWYKGFRLQHFRAGYVGSGSGSSNGNISRLATDYYDVTRTSFGLVGGLEYVPGRFNIRLFTEVSRHLGSRLGNRIVTVSSNGSENSTSIDYIFSGEQVGTDFTLNGREVRSSFDSSWEVVLGFETLYDLNDRITAGISLTQTVVAPLLIVDTDGCTSFRCNSARRGITTGHYLGFVTLQYKL